MENNNNENTFKYIFCGITDGFPINTYLELYNLLNEKVKEGFTSLDDLDYYLDTICKNNAPTHLDGEGKEKLLNLGKLGKKNEFIYAYKNNEKCTFPSYEEIEEKIKNLKDTDENKINLSKDPKEFFIDQSKGTGIQDNILKNINEANTKDASQKFKDNLLYYIILKIVKINRSDLKEYLPQSFFHCLIDGMDNFEDNIWDKFEQTKSGKGLKCTKESIRSIFSFSSFLIDNNMKDAARKVSLKVSYKAPNQIIKNVIKKVLENDELKDSLKKSTLFLGLEKWSNELAKMIIESLNKNKKLLPHIYDGMVQLALPLYSKQNECIAFILFNEKGNPRTILSREEFIRSNKYYLNSIFTDVDWKKNGILPKQKQVKKDLGYKGKKKHRK